MPDRTKKTLSAIIRGALVVAAVMVAWRLEGDPWSDLAPWTIGLGVFEAAIVVYAWWWYGPSEKAVALRAKAEAKKAERALERQLWRR